MAPIEKGKKGTKEKPKKSTEKSSKLSAEYVVDSDSDEHPAPKRKDTSSKPKKKDSKPTKSSSTKEKAHKPAPKTPPPRSSPPPRTNGTATKINGSGNRQLSSETSESDSDSGESKTSTQDSEVPQQRAKTANSESKRLDQKRHKEPVPLKHKETTKTPLSIPDSDQSSDSSSSSDSDTQEQAEKTPEALAKLISRPDPPTEYVPPKGFSRSKFKVSSDISRIFSKENLKGKQIWHITVPAAVPVSQIEELSTRSLEKGDVVLSHKGVDYGFDKETAQSETAYIPTATGRTFGAVPEPVSRVLHLNRKVKLPELERSQDSGQGLPSRTYTKPKPQQPAGLKMRYRPFGDVDSDDEAAENPVQPPQFRMPPGKSTTPRNDKRKALEDLDADIGEERSPAKKRKKDKSHSSTQEPNETADALANGNQVFTIAEGSSTKHSGETAEERAARKAAKAKRKEKKMHKLREMA